MFLTGENGVLRDQGSESQIKEGGGWGANLSLLKGLLEIQGWKNILGRGQGGVEGWKGGIHFLEQVLMYTHPSLLFRGSFALSNDFFCIQNEQDEPLGSQPQTEICELARRESTRRYVVDFKS